MLLELLELAQVPLRNCWEDPADAAPKAVGVGAGAVPQIGPADHTHVPLRIDDIPAPCETNTIRNHRVRLLPLSVKSSIAVTYQVSSGRQVWNPPRNTDDGHGVHHEKQLLRIRQQQAYGRRVRFLLDAQQALDRRILHLLDTQNLPDRRPAVGRIVFLLRKLPLRPAVTASADAPAPGAPSSAGKLHLRIVDWWLRRLPPPRRKVPCVVPLGLRRNFCNPEPLRCGR